MPNSLFLTAPAQASSADRPAYRKTCQISGRPSTLITQIGQYRRLVHVQSRANTLYWGVT